jgi:hypothetical protein
MADQKNHDVPVYEKLCALMLSPAGLDLKTLKVLIKDPKYVCRDCGRAAANEISLCVPEKL